VKTVLFGAFDRHNLGDLLLARMAAAEADGPVAWAGLAPRDLSRHGGPRVQSLAEAVGGEPVALVHVGGELLDCDAPQAAHMLGDDSLGWPRPAPYVLSRSVLPAGSTVEFRAVGGVALAQRPPAFRQQVLAALEEANAISVRDRVTQGFLAGSGLSARLVPDPVTRIAERYGLEIRAHGPQLRDYVAVQFAAEWGDDATLAALARGLVRLDGPVVLFRAGAAPWHDELEPYRRLAARLAVPCRIHESLHIWDICGLIAHARTCVATSLHVRLVADAFGVPAISLEQVPGSARKLRAYLDTWQPAVRPVALEEFAA
jgi:hypothetical protein